MGENPYTSYIIFLLQGNYLNLKIEYFIRSKLACIKDILHEVKIFEKQVKALYSCENPVLSTESMIYKKVKNAYLAGLATREEILSDVKILNLDRKVVEEFFDNIDS